MHHTQKQRKIKFEPRIKLNHNIYTVDYLLLHLFTTHIVCIINPLTPEPPVTARTRLHCFKKLQLS